MDRYILLQTQFVVEEEVCVKFCIDANVKGDVGVKLAILAREGFYQPGLSYFFLHTLLLFGPV